MSPIFNARDFKSYEKFEISTDNGYSSDASTEQLIRSGGGQMNLSIEKASKLLNKVGIATSVDQDSIKEVVPYYDNFYQLKKINQAWEYSLVIKEQTNQPSQLEVKVFQDEAEGIKYFFLK